MKICNNIIELKRNHSNLFSKTSHRESMLYKNSKNIIKINSIFYRNNNLKVINKLKILAYIFLNCRFAQLKTGFD